MGGLISFMMLWEYPDVFSKGACLSPAFQVRNLDYITRVKKDAGEKKDIKVYIDNGEIGIESEIQPGIDNMLQELREQGYTEGKDFIWSLHKEAEHSEKAWAKRFPGILKFLFGREAVGK
jgi:predicted alpha/beta superfamily hydrolase